MINKIHKMQISRQIKSVRNAKMMQRDRSRQRDEVDAQQQADQQATEQSGGQPPLQRGESHGSEVERVDLGTADLNRARKNTKKHGSKNEDQPRPYTAHGFTLDFDPRSKDSADVNSINEMEKLLNLLRHVL